MSLYIHIFTHHLLKKISDLKKLDLTILEVDQSSFELGNLILKNITKGQISKFPKKSKISKNTTEDLKRNQMLNFQKVLKWKPGMKDEKWGLYQKQYQALQIMLIMLRRLYMAAFYDDCELIELPDMNIPPHSQEKKTEKNNKFYWFDKIEPATDEELNAMMDQEVFEKEPNYKEIEKEYNKNTTVYQDVTMTADNQQQEEQEHEQPQEDDEMAECDEEEVEEQGNNLSNYQPEQITEQEEEDEQEQEQQQTIPGWGIHLLYCLVWE